MKTLDLQSATGQLIPLSAIPSQASTSLVRWAREAEELAVRKEADYHELPCRNVISRCNSPRVPFPWSINPYRGCAFGCVYCYARYTHEFLVEKSAVTRDRSYETVPATIMDFERRIYVKTGAAAALRQELRRRDYRGEHIAIGTATDPYQPAERRFKITRSLLETLADRHGMHLSITTKSDLVLRDLDLLREITRHSLLHVNITVTTLDTRLARELEPLAPRPDKRLAAVRELVDAGISCGVFIMPIIPFINDSEPQLDALLSAAATAGAAYVGYRTLFLRDCSRARFYPWLKQHRPEIYRRLRQLMDRDADVEDEYQDRIMARVRRLLRRHGIPSGSEYRQPPPPLRSQMTLNL